MAKTKTQYDPNALIAGFSIDQHAFSDLLSAVGRAVASRPSHAVLANLLFRVDDATQTVTLSAFDLSLGIERTAQVIVTKEGSFTLPAKMLTDIVSKLSPGNVSCHVFDMGYEQTPLAPSEEGTPPEIYPAPKAVLQSGRSSYEVTGMPATEFPMLPEWEDSDSPGQLTLDVNDLIAGTKHTLFSVSTDETKQVLTGIHLSTKEDVLDFASTCGHRLSAVSITAEEGTDHPELDLTIPAKAMQELLRLVEKSMPDVVELKFTDSQAIFTWEGYKITSRLLEGQYPNYRQLIPRQFSKELTVDRKQLISSLERLAVLADQKNNIVNLSLSDVDQELTISVAASEVGSGEEDLSVQYSGDAVNAAFNIKYLLDALKVISTSEVQMSLNTATSPVIIIPLGGIKFTNLIMPVQIRS